jgi:hypothetical protein
MPGLPTQTWAELVRASGSAPPPQLIAGLIAEGDTVLLYGYSGLGKSLYALELALAIARGEPFLGQLGATRSTVGMLDEESHAPRLGGRLAAIAAAHGIDPDQGGLPLFSVGAGARLDTEAGLERLFCWIRENDLGLLLVDTLRRVHRLRENESDDMARIEAAVKTLQQRARDELARVLTVVLIHHSPKPRELASNAAETMARGSGDIFASVDVALYLRRGREAGQIVVEHAKARWSEPMPPMLLRIEGSEEGGLAMRYVGTVDDIAQQLDRGLEVVLAALADGPLTRQQLLERTGAAKVPARTTDRALKALVSDGKLAKSRAGRAAIYALTESGLLG